MRMPVPGRGGPTVPILILSGVLTATGAVGLGQAVALEDDEADAAVEVTEAGPERCTARHGIAHLAAHGGTQLAVDEAVEDEVLQPKRQTRAARVEGLAVADGDGGGAEEDLALALAGGLRLGRVEDLLEDARHGEYEGRLEAGEVVEQRLDVGRVAHARLARDAEHLDEAREDVGEGQEQQGRGVLGQHDVAELLDGVLGEVDEVAVRQLAALGAAGGARRVDDRRDGSPVEARAPRVELGVGDVTALLAQRVEAAPLDLDDVAQAGQVGPHLVDDGPVRGRLDDRDVGVGVGEDPLHLLGRGRLVDRHDDGTRAPGGEVDERPLVARARHQGDPVAGCDPGGDQALGQAGDVVGEPAPRDVRPPAGGRLARERRLAANLLRVADHQVREAALRRDGGQWCDDVVLHCHSCW